MRAIRMERTGGPEVLRPVEVEDPEPGDGQVLLDVAACGVNYIDTYQRSGLYPVDLPFVPGAEGAGTVSRVGPGVRDLRVGDRVAWADGGPSYAQRVALDAARAVRVPDGVGLETAAAVMLQGLTAHYLTRDSYRLGPGDRCLVHAAAGGVGSLLVQVARLLGAEVFATVGSAVKAEQARADGADHVVLYRDEDFGAAVERIAGPRPIDVVYDGVGRSTFARGLDVLRPRGTMVTFGNASGTVEPLAPLELMRAGSLFLTRPKLDDHVADAGELQTRARELLAWVEQGRVRVRVGTRLGLADAERAHRLLESRATSGKVLLVP